MQNKRNSPPKLSTNTLSTLVSYKPSKLEVVVVVLEQVAVLCRKSKSDTEHSFPRLDHVASLLESRPSS
uniref:Uncharacterized protein n=1 Tax=Physcomitrium patens TaxID=3218 RepID=A0A2K1IXL6_PHYPA|nr:hypothetical protein PHYPA_023833 [Physcomitrium patens]